MAGVAVVVFPGSNCDRDAFHVAQETLGVPVTYHWHDEPVTDRYGAVILPGGFSYGDYLRAGALATISPAVQSLGKFIERGGLVLGICNGFQVLCEAGFLPGALTKNQSLSFQCQDVFVRVESNRSPFLTKGTPKKVLRLRIAHSEGRYVADADTLGRMEKKGQIALRYCSAEGEVGPEHSVNGSMGSIAGITNEKGNVFGLMPHPERCADEILKDTDGLVFFESLKANL